MPVRVPAGDRVRDPARVAAELGAVRARGGRQAEGRLEREAVEALVAVAQLAEPRLQLGGARRRAITHVSEVRARGVDGRCAVPSRRGRRRRGRRGRRGPPRAREAHFRRLARDRRPRALAHSSRAGNGRCSRLPLISRRIQAGGQSLGQRTRVLCAARGVRRGFCKINTLQQANFKNF